MKPERKIPVIIDTDPGVDDLLALKLAFDSPLLDLRLICSVAGNVSIEQTTENALYLAQTFGCGVPVARGLESPRAKSGLNAAQVHGQGGLGAFRIPPHAFQPLADDAVSAMRAMLAAAEQPVTLITLGPLTNLAALLEADPAVHRKIAHVYAMIASVDGTGNATPYAEFNAHCDPEALQTVLNAGLAITFAPMHLGSAIKLSQREILRRCNGAFKALLTQVFQGYRDQAVASDDVAIYDLNAVAALTHPALYRFVRCRASVDTVRHPGQTFLTPDPAGPFRYAEVPDPAALKQALLADLSR